MRGSASNPQDFKPGGPKGAPLLLMRHRYQLTEICLSAAIRKDLGRACCL
jgi:hypothetical protein